MPVAVCPHCRAELDLDTEDIGALVECPACQTQFTAVTGPISASPLPPSEPESGMAPPVPPPTTPGTRVIACPECGEQVTVMAEDLGHTLRCPLCARRFRAPREPSAEHTADPPWRNAVGPPPRRASDYDSRRREQYDDYNDRARRRRLWPYREHDDTPQELVRYAKTECAAPSTGLIVVGVLTVLVGMWRAVSTFWMLDEFADSGLYLLLGYGLYSVLVGGFWIFAGIQMKEAKLFGLSMIACITVIIPGVSPCCILGLIFGTMGISKLNDPRVKRGFQANQPGFDPDAPA